MRSAHVLILTPVKNASPFLETYFSALEKLTYPRELISLGFLESDSRDDTYERIAKHAAGLSSRYRRVGVWKRDFGFEMPAGTPRWSPPWQMERRAILARSRNHLLFRALDDEDWVLWIDADVIDYPADILERLLATGKDIVHPHCLIKVAGEPARTFDLNAWRDRGLTSGEGRPFHRLIIRNIRDEYGLRSREQRLRDAGMLTLAEMASRLGVPAKTVKIWHHAGLITGHPYNDKGQCLYPPPGPNPPTRAQGRKLSERRPGRHTAPADDQ